MDRIILCVAGVSNAVDNAKIESTVVRANHCIIAEDCGDSTFQSNDLYPFGWGFGTQHRRLQVFNPGSHVNSRR